MAFSLLSFSAARSASTAAANSSFSASSILSSTKAQGSPWLYTTAAVVISLLVLEQLVYRSKKRHLPGDNWTIPIIGKFIDSRYPSLENYQKGWAKGELSALSVFNIFIVMASNNYYSRKILNSPMHAEPCLVYSAKQVLRPDNWVFLTGKAHVEFRRDLNALFTRRALSIYVPIQEAMARKHIARWIETAKDGQAHPIMMTARELNMETSLRVFCGNHLPDHAAKEINDNYWKITKALELVNFPIPLPGTKVWNAIQCRKRAMYWLELACARSRVAVAEGREPECMLEEWISTFTAPDHKGRNDFTDTEMAMVLLSFLFASQDAMSSGLIYLFQHLADSPRVLQKVREEQEALRKGDYTTPLTLEMLNQMTYLNATIKESMRVKPPVTMVPYKTVRPFPLNDEYTAPAGSIVIPSFYNSLHDPEIYPEPDEFLPERWLDPEGLANANPKNYLVFGSGVHRCIGYDYVYMNMALVISTALGMGNWEHEVTPLSGEVEMIATLFPKDGCRLKWTPRETS